MDGSKIRTGWPQHFLRSLKYLCTHYYVLLLHGSCDGTAIPEIHLVEKISHYVPNGKNILFHCSEIMIMINVNTMQYVNVTYVPYDYTSSTSHLIFFQ